MVTTTTPTNASIFSQEFDWLYKVIETRLNAYFQNDGVPTMMVTPPVYQDSANAYVHALKEFELSMDERIILLLAMAPHIKPQLLDVFFTQNTDLQRGFAEFGGVQGKAHSGFLPTVETALFLLAGNDLDRRFKLMNIFDPDHLFFRFGILKLHEVETEEPFAAQRIDVETDFMNQCLFGKVRDPQFGPSFPAKKLDTQMEWADLVLNPFTMEELSELRMWLDHGEHLMQEWGLGRKMMPGYRCLFHGPPGTGKTLAASLLSKISGRRVYRIDLSMIVSKYIGETEKNLEKVFTQAEQKNWILFFDEADALFGKRTNVSDSHDRFANQETSYLLQRVEVFPGVVILSTNLKSNIDEAFSRRFQSIIHFPMPDPEQRHQLWSQSFSSKSTLDEKLDLRAIAEKYEISGGAIMNVIRYASLQAMGRSSTVISADDLHRGIRREFLKDGRNA